jgi:hypothetical protein
MDDDGMREKPIKKALLKLCSSVSCVRKLRRRADLELPVKSIDAKSLLHDRRYA